MIFTPTPKDCSYVNTKQKKMKTSHPSFRSTTTASELLILFDQLMNWQFINPLFQKGYWVFIKKYRKQFSAENKDKIPVQWIIVSLPKTWERVVGSTRLRRKLNTSCRWQYLATYLTIIRCKSPWWWDLTKILTSMANKSIQYILSKFPIKLLTALHRCFSSIIVKTPLSPIVFV